jgi:phage-related protein
MGLEPAPPKPPAPIHEAILALPMANIEAMRAEIASRKLQVEDFGPAYAKIAATSVGHATSYAVAFTRTVQTTAQLEKLFSIVAVAPAADRHAIVVAHRDAGDGATVVHAVGAQPTAMARALMQEFLMDGGDVHAQAAADLAEWLQMAGGVLIETGVTPPAPTALHDGFFGDLWNDVKKAAGAVVQAVKTVADAVGSAVGDFVKGIGHAIGAVANWAAAQVKNFVHAVLSAGKAIGDLISGALNAGYAALKKIVEGILAVGRAVRDVLQSVANFAVEAVESTFRALKELGSSLANFVGFLVGKSFDLVKKFVDAAIRAGEQVANVIAEAVRFGANLVADSVKAMIEVGQAAATILIAAITHPANLGVAVLNALHTLGHGIGSLLDDVKAKGVQFVNSVAEAAARIASDLSDLATYASRATIDIAKEVVKGVLAAGQTIGTLVIHLAQEGVEGIQKILEAAFALDSRWRMLPAG